MSKVWRFRMAMAALTALVICGALTSAVAKKKPKAQSRTRLGSQIPSSISSSTRSALRSCCSLRTCASTAQWWRRISRICVPDKDLGPVPVSDQYFLGRVKPDGCR